MTTLEHEKSASEAVIDEARKGFELLVVGMDKTIGAKNGFDKRIEGMTNGATLCRPKNVTLLPSAPHDAVMKEVSLVVTHGGHGTVSRALWHGLPLLVMPMGRDQNDIAARVEAHGVGLSLPSTASEAEIAGALNHLIKESHFRVAARRLGDAIASDIESERLVGEMEEIVRA